MSCSRPCSRAKTGLIYAGGMLLLVGACRRFAHARVRAWERTPDEAPAATGCARRTAGADAIASEDGNWVWCLALQRRHGSTRLVSRDRIRTDTATERIVLPAMELSPLLMERKRLYGIRQWADGGAAEFVPFNLN